MANAPKPPQNDGSWKSEMSGSLRKRFWWALAVYALGFLVLASIGEAINDNGYMFRAFLAPFLVFGAIGFIVWNFFFTD